MGPCTHQEEVYIYTYIVGSCIHFLFVFVASSCKQVIDKLNLEDEMGSVTGNARQASLEYTHENQSSSEVKRTIDFWCKKSDAARTNKQNLAAT